MLPGNLGPYRSPKPLFVIQSLCQTLIWQHVQWPILCLPPNIYTECVWKYTKQSVEKPREAHCTCVLFIAFHCDCGCKWKELAWSRTLAKTIAGCTGNWMILMFVVYIVYLCVRFSWKVCADASGGTSADQISYSVPFSLPICFSLSTDWQHQAVTTWNIIFSGICPWGQ